MSRIWRRAPCAYGRAVPDARPGRPRSEQSRRAVLEAARDLLADGYERLTIDAIATRAGVSRQTIYRWWSSKAQIVADAVIDGTIPLDVVALRSTGDVRDDLRSWLSGVARTASTGAGLVLALTAAAASDPAANRELYRRVTGPDRQAIIDRLEAARDAGRLRSVADVPVGVDAILGWVLMHLLSGAPLTDDGIEALLDTVLGGLGNPRSSP